MLRVFIISFFIIFLLSAYSQTNIEFHKSNFKGDKKALKVALLHIEDGDYYYSLTTANADLALEYYLKANKYNPYNALLNYKIGLCYIYAKPASKALEYFKKAQKLNNNVHPKVNYFIGKALQLDMQSDKAIVYFNKYKDNMSPGEASKMLDKVDKNIEQCKLASEMVKNPKRVFIENLGSSVNSEYPDYGVVVNIDESMMFYTSRRLTTTGGKRSPLDMLYFEDTYWAISEDGKWLNSNNMGKPINNQYHDAVVGIAPDGNTLIIYRSDHGGDLYWSKHVANSWTAPKAFPSQINTKYQESSASFSANGKRLFFVSDRPKGFGGKDIYYVDIDNDGEMGPVVNLGNTINTPSDEIGVFAHADGKTIYFSSKGHPGIGSFDVYKSEYNNNLWSKPLNLGYPVNTPGPDVFFTIGASGRNAYFSTSREGGFGGQDIYKITFLGHQKEPTYGTSEQLIAVDDAINYNAKIESKLQMYSSQLTLLKGVIRDDITNKPIEATIELIDNETGEILARFASNSLSGKYVISLPSGNNYGLAVYSDNYLFYSDNFEIPKYEQYRVLTMDINLQRVAVGSAIELKNVFFSYKKVTVNKKSKVELDRIVALMNKYSKLKLEVNGHTDNIGDHDYNLKLSQKRAESVVNYLVSKGVARERLLAKGYGFTKPISNNDTEEGRSMNRRSEIIIVGK